VPALPVKVISPAVVRLVRRPQLNNFFDKCGDVPGDVRKIDALKPDQSRNKKAKSLGILLFGNEKKRSKVHRRALHALGQNKPAEFIVEKGQGSKHPAV